MTASAIKTIEYQLYEYLIELRMLYGFLDADDIISDIQNYIELVKTRYYRIAMIGMFKRGKSSVINALLGHAILPSDIRPATATINRITFSPTENAAVVYRNGKCENIEIDELGDYVSKANGHGSRLTSDILEVVVGYPSVLCQNYIDIIDTPGLEDDETLTRLTLDKINDIDAAIVVISALMPCSESEQRLITRLIEADNIHNLVFAVSFIDCLDGDVEIERVLLETKRRISEGVYSQIQDEHALKKAHRILDDMAIYGVSSRDALLAFSKNDRQLLKKSRFPVFKDELYKLVTAAQTTNMTEKIRSFVKKAISGLDGRYETRRAELERGIAALDGSVRDVMKKRSTLYGQFDTALRRMSGELDRSMAALMLYGEFFASVERDIRMGLARISSDKEIRETVSLLTKKVNSKLLHFSNDLLSGSIDAFIREFTATVNAFSGDIAKQTLEACYLELKASLTAALHPIETGDSGDISLCAPEVENAITLYADLRRHFFDESVTLHSVLEVRFRIARAAFFEAVRQLETLLIEAQLSLEDRYRAERDALSFLNLSYKQSRLKSEAILGSMACEGGI